MTKKKTVTEEARELKNALAPPKGAARFQRHTGAAWIDVEFMELEPGMLVRKHEPEGWGPAWVVKTQPVERDDDTMGAVVVTTLAEIMETPGVPQLRPIGAPGDYCMTAWVDKGHESHASAFPWPVASGAVKGRPLAMIVEGALVCDKSGDGVRWAGTLYEGQRGTDGGARAGTVLATAQADGVDGRANVKRELERAASIYVVNGGKAPAAPGSAVKARKR